VLYLHGDTGAASCTPEGGLLTTPPTTDSQIRYTYDPLDPVVNYGGPLLNMLSGCTREEAHCDRADVLTFSTPPFPSDRTVDGEILLELSVSSSAPNTAFVGRLSLVLPDGNAYYLRQGAMALSHREGNDRQAPAVPG
jgi:predicted acyl esterase